MYETVKEEKNFEVENKYRNWYMGLTKVNLPYISMHKITKNMHFYRHFTVATSGSVTTEGLGDNYDSDKFKMKANYEFQIILHANITRMNFGNLTLVMEMVVDTKETAGLNCDEFAGIKSGDYGLEQFRYTGNKSVIRRYLVNDKFDEDEHMYTNIEFKRDMNKVDMQHWRR